MRKNTEISSSEDFSKSFSSLTEEELLLAYAIALQYTIGYDYFNLQSSRQSVTDFCLMIDSNRPEPTSKPPVGTAEKPTGSSSALITSSETAIVPYVPPKIAHKQ